MLIVALGLLAAALYQEIFLEAPIPFERSLAVALFAALVFVGIARLQKLYVPNQLLLWNVQVSNVIWIWCASFFLLSGWLFMWKSGEVSRGAVMTFWVLGLVVLIAQRAFWRFFIERALEKGSLRGRKIIVIARKVSAMDAKFAHRLVRYGYDMQSEFVVADTLESESRRKSRRRHLLRARLRHRRDPADHPQRGSALARHHRRSVAHPAGAGDLDRRRRRRRSRAPSLVRDRLLGRDPDAEAAAQPRRARAQARDRHVDRERGADRWRCPCCSLVAIAIKLDSKGPVLFWQTRRGFNGKPFRIAKFRSMTVLEDGGTIRQATRRDARVTRVGAFLRRTLDRRIAAALERAARRHVARRPAPACGRA